MRIAKPLLLLLIPLASCSQEGQAPIIQHHDPVLVKARAMQALVCVELDRVPPTWQSNFRLSGPGTSEIWQTISEQPLLDHGQRISTVLREGTGQVYLVVQGRLPEIMLVYGPLSTAPRCQGAE